MLFFAFGLLVSFAADGGVRSFKRKAISTSFFYEKKHENVPSCHLSLSGELYIAKLTMLFLRIYQTYFSAFLQQYPFVLTSLSFYLRLDHNIQLY